MNVRLLEPVTEGHGGAHVVTALRELQADEGAMLLRVLCWFPGDWVHCLLP